MCFKSSCLLISIILSSLVLLLLTMFSFNYGYIFLLFASLYLKKFAFQTFIVDKRMCLVTQSHPILCDPVDCSRPGSSVHGDSPGKNTGVGCQALLQRIFPTQGLIPGLPLCRQILYQLSHEGSKRILE